MGIKKVVNENIVLDVLIFLKKIKSVAYSSQGSTPVNLTSATDWHMDIRRDNVISILLSQVYKRRLS